MPYPKARLYLKSKEGWMMEQKLMSRGVNSTGAGRETARRSGE